MSPASRRALLRTGVAACPVVLGGCTGLFGDEAPPPEQEPTARTSTESGPRPPTADPSSSPFETPAPGECEATEPPRPTPVEEFKPAEYPAFPDTLSARSAEGFAREYEEAYQYNAYLAEEAGPETRSIGVDASAADDLTAETDDGFLVGVGGELSTSEGNGTVVVADDPIESVYHLAPGFALRGELREAPLYEVESLTSVDLYDVRTIVCRTTGEGG